MEAGIEVGTQILKEYLNKTGSLKGALKYYVGAAKHSHDGGYSRKVLSMRNHLRLAASGQVEAAKIQARAPSNSLKTTEMVRFLQLTVPIWPVRLLKGTRRLRPPAPLTGTDQPNRMAA